MRKVFPTEFFFQLFALILAVIVVHALFVAVVRPEAEDFLSAQRALIESNPEHVVERSLYVLIKDFEQEACFILMLWALSIMSYKGVATYRERRLLDEDIIGLAGRQIVRAADVPALFAQIAERPRRWQALLLPRALCAGLRRLAATGSIQDVSTATREVCEAEAERLDSELSIVRYIAWAIPSIGFIGTVRGIGDALAQAHQAVEGDITGVTQSLGVAFNSTFVALVISIVVMFFVHQLQRMQERIVLDTEAYCDDHLIAALRGE